MTTTNKILPVALVAALLGGSVGAFVMRPSRQVETTDETRVTSPATVSRNLASNSDASGEVLNVADKSEVASNEAGLSADERDCYRDGFNDGIKAARENRSNVSTVTRYAPAPAASRVVYRPAARTRYARSNNTRRVYYDYNQQPRSRSFWSKHRDKLTVAAGTGAGAIIGGLIGGKKGAAIGALGGAGGSALYTYKLRKRNRNY